MKNWKYVEGAKVGNDIPDAQINGPSAAEIREVAGRIYKTDMREDDLARAVSFELAKKYKAFQTNTHLMDMVKEVLKKYKTGNSKTGNESLGEYMAKKPRVINEEKTGAEEFFKKLADDVKEREDKDDADIEKVGNANLETSVEKGKLGLWNWYVHKNGTIVAGGTSSTETNAKEMARKALEKEKAGNKVGNAFTSSDKKRLDELARKKPTQLTPQEWKEFQDLNKREEEASREMLKKSGNSASDDKFAYVMREFDEGKLKTPDGKVVTDPAQAKAIAYSESKKTENGLARARNAIKKS